MITGKELPKCLQYIADVGDNGDGNDDNDDDYKGNNLKTTMCHIGLAPQAAPNFLAVALVCAGP